jgi:ubiquinol-cytochrome c reductase cytochrome c1 subunit
MADKLFPGYQDKLWAKTPPALKSYQISSENGGFEKAMKSHESWQAKFLDYKAFEAKLAPSFKYRKPAVDWRRQIARGTMHYGRGWEGPYGSDYRPGNTHDRLENTREPFTDAEWEERKDYRSFDLMKLGYSLMGIFLLYRVTEEWPVCWCEEQKAIEDKTDEA